MLAIVYISCLFLPPGGQYLPKLNKEIDLKKDDSITDINLIKKIN
jgi:hypothetical protein